MAAGTKLQQQQGPTSPTASVSESNIVASTVSAGPEANDALAGLQALRFDGGGDIDDAEIQSPDIALWESIFADQIGASSGADFLLSMSSASPRRDFMACSPRREFMASSPKRDYMVTSSPVRDYMVSSPKREYMVTSPRREMVSSPRRTTFSNLYTTTSHGGGHHQSYVHGGGMEGAGHGAQLLYSGLAGHGKGKSQSPLHKVYINNGGGGAHSSSSSHGGDGKSNTPSTLSCSSSYVHGAESDLPASLPSMDPFLEEGYLASYQLPDNASGGAPAPAVTAPSSSQQLPTLSECLAMPEPAYRGGGEEAVTAAMAAGGLPVGALGHPGMYYGGGGGGGQFGEGMAPPLQHQMAKADQWAADSSLHSMLGSVVQSEAEQCSLVFHNNILNLEQDSGLQLVHLLLACADMVSKGDQPAALRHLHLLRRVASPLGDSMQRVASYFADALAARLSLSPSASAPPPPRLSLSPSASASPLPLPPSPETLKVYQILYQACPYIKFAHFTANQAIFEAFHGEDRVHRRVGEALAVNAVNRLHRVPGAHLPALLSMVRDQAPKIMTLVEQEAGHNGPYFLGRFLEALHYYSAIFDSLDATFPADSAARMKVEQCLLAPEIRNVVACEGAERVARHERLERWRRLMEGRGFEAVPLSPAAVGQSQVLLGLYGAGDGYRLTEDGGRLLPRGPDRAPLAASAWRC
uniref:Uncharacterized protein n=1 Tax=Oryza brachyantha TaxID=4533 RepID=J3N8K3_ORYBR